MNPTIKFRAWHKAEKRWIDIVGLNFDRRFKTSHPFVTDYMGQSYRVEEIELMQFTGLHDKNDKEIYGGNVATDEHDNIYEIKWGKNAAAFRRVDHKLKTITAMEGKEIEIIGNIYEHGELIGKYPESFTSEAQEETREGL